MEWPQPTGYSIQDAGPNTLLETTVMGLTQANLVCSDCLDILGDIFEVLQQEST